MAEALLRLKLPSRLQDEVDIQSAGTLGIEGMPAADFAIEVVAEMGGDLDGHRSQGVTPDLVANADLILAMANEHVNYLHRKYPGYRENVYLLKRFANDDIPDEPEVDDPIGFGKTVYRECADIIAEELDRIMPAIVTLVQNHRRDAT